MIFGTRTIINLLKAFGRFVRGLFSHKPLFVTEQEWDRRMGVCNGCLEHFDGQCAVCTCFVGTKAWFRTEKCPLGRWRKP